jgi:hypothetical protein
LPDVLGKVLSLVVENLILTLGLPVEPAEEQRDHNADDQGSYAYNDAAILA